MLTENPNLSHKDPALHCSGSCCAGSHSYPDSIPDGERERSFRGGGGAWAFTHSPVVWQWITRMLAISANLTLEGFFLISFKNSPRTTSHLPTREKGRSIWQPGPISALG